MFSATNKRAVLSKFFGIGFHRIQPFKKSLFNFQHYKSKRERKLLAYMEYVNVEFHRKFHRIPQSSNILCTLYISSFYVIFFPVINKCCTPTLCKIVLYLNPFPLQTALSLVISIGNSDRDRQTNKPLKTLPRLIGKSACGDIYAK